MRQRRMAVVQQVELRINWRPYRLKLVPRMDLSELVELAANRNPTKVDPRLLLPEKTSCQINTSGKVEAICFMGGFSAAGESPKCVD